jgi:hypothetical protein
MRTLTADTRSRIEHLDGENPILVVKFNLAGGTQWFSDRDVTIDGIRLDGRLAEAGSLDNGVRVDSGTRIVGAVSTMKVVLCDDDLVMKCYMDAHELQGTNVTVYHWFGGQTQADLVTLLSGRIETNPTWREMDRTIEFVVETPRRLKPIPFAPTEADALDINLEHLGKPWPMIFGTPSDVPATLVKEPPRGTLAQDVTQDGTMGTTLLNGIQVPIDVPGNVFDVENPNDDFPQGNEVMIRVADEFMTGHFTGNTFTVSRRQVNKYTGVQVSGTGAIVELPPGIRAVGMYIIIRPATTVATGQTSSLGIDGVTESLSTEARTAVGELPWIGEPNLADAGMVGYVYKQVGNLAYIWNGSSAYLIQNAVADINRYPYAAADGAKWVHKAGSPVVVYTKAIVYIANQIGTNQVIRARAFRQVVHDDFSGYSKRQIVSIDPALYTVKLSDPAYKGATTLTFVEKLSDRDAGWEDQVYVTVESAVRRNVADQLAYLVNNFSEGALTAGPSFTTIRTDLSPYPADYGITEQRDVLDHVGDIAWQARCGVTWNGATANLIYLSKEPTSQVIDVNDDSAAEGTTRLTSTRIEDVVTVLHATWQPNGSDLFPKRIVVQTNVDRFGKREQEYKFWIYQKRTLVKKSVDFWAARRGRIWRMAGAEMSGLEAIGVDPLDYVGWDVSALVPGFKALVTMSSMPDFNYTEFTAVLPVEGGSTTKSPYFWFSDAGDTAPALPNYAVGSPEQEIIKAPPPEVTTIQATAQQVFHVTATEDEVNDPAASNWKTVQVRIKSAVEVANDAQLTQNNARLSQIQFLDPDGHNSALLSEKTTLEQSNQDLNASNDNEVNNAVIVTARNLSVSYMKTAYTNDSGNTVPADQGTMIKVAGGEYIVTPANTVGPHIAKVTKKPASPAEGTLWADIGTSISNGIDGAQKINVLGDGSGIKLNDVLLVFKDAAGNYYTPGGGSATAVAAAQIIATTGDKNNIPVSIWLTGNITGSPDLTTTAIMPQLASPYKVVAGAWTLAGKLTDGTWVLQMPVVQSYVP